MGDVSYPIGPNQLKYLLTRPINFARTQSNSPLLVTCEVVAAVTVSHCSRYILDLIADYAATRRTVSTVNTVNRGSGHYTKDLRTFNRMILMVRMKMDHFYLTIEYF